MTDSRPTILWTALVVLFAAYALLAWRMGGAPVWGPYKVRQADTLFAAYSMCERGTHPLLPRIANHEDRQGIEIGELPVTAWLHALPCLLFGWSTRCARLLTLAIFALATWVWGRWLHSRTDSEELAATWMLVFATTALHIETLMTPLPDGVALLLIGLAGCLWRERWLSGRGAAILATLCFVTGILVRPYLLPLLFLLSPGWRKLAVTAALSVVGYLLWYHLWVPQSETMYYAVDPRPLAAVWTELPLVLDHLGSVLLAQLNGIGVIALLWAAWGNIRERSVWIWLATLVAVIAMQGIRIVPHPYYVIGGSLAATVAMVLGLRAGPRALRHGFVIVYAGIGLAQATTLLDEPTADRQRQVRALVAGESEPTAVFATYLERHRYWLFVIERSGWVFSSDDWIGAHACPAGVDYALTWRAPDEAELVACQR